MEKEKLKIVLSKLGVKLRIKYKRIQPEVIVGLGSNTVFKEIKPPFRTIEELHIELEDWLGDDLMECFPVYVVTEKLKEELNNSSFSGFNFKTMEVTNAEYFGDNYQLDIKLPKFYWMEIVGEFRKDDFVLSDKKELLINEKFLKVLVDKFKTKYLEIEPKRNEFDDLLDEMLSES